MKYLLLPILTILFASCTLPGTQIESSDETIVQYEGTGFSTSLPKTWTQADVSLLPIPSRWSVVAAFIAPEVRYGFSHNYIIMMDEIKSPITSRKYSELNHIQTTKNYLEYTKLQQSVITFADTDTSTLYVFEARYNKTTSQMKFLQTAKVCGTRVYLLHASVALGQNTNNYEKLFSSFTCK